MRPAVLHRPDFVSAAVDLTARAAGAAVAARGLFRLGLAGGNSPRAVYAALAEAALPWERFVVTFGDERCVPPDHPESNYGMARETLLGRVPIPAAQIYRMRGELPPAEAAAAYDRLLAALATGDGAGDPFYRHDLLLLGIGDDGHTASLFPATAALAATGGHAVANWIPQLGSGGADRLTLTFTAINAARHVLFLVADERKARVVAAILAGDSGLPAAHVAPAAGRLTWLLGWEDRAISAAR